LSLKYDILVSKAFAIKLNLYRYSEQQQRQHKADQAEVRGCTS
jgi:hypothetical protein